MSATNENAIQALLEQTEAAHGEYQTRELGGVNDEAWASWYAAYLVEHGLTTLVGGQPVAVDLLSDQLTRLDEAYRRQQPAITWPAYCADHLTGRDPGRPAGQ